MRLALTLALTTCLLIGCGQSDPAPTEGGGTDMTSTQTPPPIASIGSPAASSDTSSGIQTASSDGGGMTLDVSPGDADQASPEWALEEIALLRAQPIPDDPKKVGAIRRERNTKIIELAAKVIAETHENPKQETFFNNAVKQLLESRLEMALAGQPDDIDQLYDDVKDLDERDHASPAAEEGAFTLVRYAHANAQRFATSDPRWFQELAQQARLYADGYPTKTDRAAPILFAAARSCEIHSPKMEDPKLRTSLLKEAMLCYTTLKQQFSEHVNGQRAVAILRRLRLRGTELKQFAGPLLNGKNFRIDMLRGRTPVLVFWSSENEKFARNVETLKATINKYKSAGVYMIGVSLDKDELDANAFITKHSLPGQTVFFKDPGKQRWDNPLVNYWGVVEIPTVWVLNKDGVVVSTDVSIDQLDQLLAQVVK